MQPHKVTDFHLTGPLGIADPLAQNPILHVWTLLLRPVVTSLVNDFEVIT